MFENLKRIFSLKIHCPKNYQSTRQSSSRPNSANRRNTGILAKGTTATSEQQLGVDVGHRLRQTGASGAAAKNYGENRRHTAISRTNTMREQNYIYGEEKFLQTASLLRWSFGGLPNLDQLWTTFHLRLDTFETGFE